MSDNPKQSNIPVVEKMDSSYRLKEIDRRRREQPWWRRRWRVLYRRLLRLQGSSYAIARGIACGVFAGSFPILGLQTIIGVLLAVICRGNKFAAAASTWISNPLTYVPIFALNYQVGQLILGSEDIVIDDIHFQSTDQLLDLGGQFVITLLVGCSLVGLIVAIASYFFSLRLIQRLRHTHRRSHSPRYDRDYHHF
ncbi:MAG: DUF2062 domain-containing protein [Chroococcales cyanobacterium]